LGPNAIPFAVYVTVERIADRSGTEYTAVTIDSPVLVRGEDGRSQPIKFALGHPEALRSVASCLLGLLQDPHAIAIIKKAAPADFEGIE